MSSSVSNEAPPCKPVRCLVVDDDADMLRTIQWALEPIQDLEVTLASRGDVAVQLLEDESTFDLVVTDLRMPGAGGGEVLRRVRALSPDIPVLVISAVASVEELLALQDAGATMFLCKPFAVVELRMMVRHARHVALQLRNARDLNRVAPQADVTLPGMVGRSPAFLRALVHLTALARTDAPLLIGGETGTGKELVARAAHELSPRKDGPFVAVNCSALTEALVDSELFGHEKGSFTGAVGDKPGLFRSAKGGSILLDEVGDLAPSAQAKLLRVLQEHEVRPVGATRGIKLNVRVIAATHQDLPRMVQEGRFREDLLYRLRVGQVTLPPLRRRPDDIMLLAHTFLERRRKEFGCPATAFTPGAVDAMMAYRWPGNVRELEAAVTRGAAVCTSSVITPEDMGLDPAARGGEAEPLPPVPGAPFAEAKRLMVLAFERAYLARLLGAQPSMTLAAKQAGLDRKSLYRLLKKHGRSVDDDAP